MNIFEKLAYIQQHLRARKDLRNDFGGYNYRSAESILEATKPHLAEVGAALVITDDLTMIGDRYYIKATASLIDTESGQSYSTSAYARETSEKKGMDSAQITGSASSYARKYALSGLLSIDNCDDPDALNTHGKPPLICEKCGHPVTAEPGAPIPTILGQAERFYRRPACVCANCLRADVSRLNAAKAKRRAAEEARKAAEKTAEEASEVGLGKIVDHVFNPGEIEPCSCCGAPVERGNLIETEFGRVCADCFEKEVGRDE